MAGPEAVAYHSSAGFLTVAERYLSRTKSQELLVRTATLILIYVLAFSIRLVRGPLRGGWEGGRGDAAVLLSAIAPASMQHARPHSSGRDVGGDAWARASFAAWRRVSTCCGSVVCPASYTLGFGLNVISV